MTRRIYLVATLSLLCLLLVGTPAHARVTTLGTTTSAIGNGSAVNFPFPNGYCDKSHLVVTVAGALKVLGSDYTVSQTNPFASGSSTGGTVVFGAAPASGTAVVITRETPKTQPSAYTPTGPLPAATLERNLDCLTYMSQEAAVSTVGPPGPAGPPGSSGPWLNVADFGVVPGASAAANCINLQAAVNAVPASGGGIVFTEYGIHTSCAINVTKPLVVQGPGTTEVSTPGTFVLYLDTASQTGFNVTAKGSFALQGFSIFGAANTTHVKSNGPTGPLKGTENLRIDNVVFNGGGTHVDCANCIFYNLTRNTFWNYSAFGVRVHNSLDVDQGDGTISGNTFSGPIGANGVYWTAGGGLRITNNKFLAGDYGIQLDAQTAGPNSDVMIAGNSIENFNSGGVLITRSIGSGAFGDVHIVNNQFGAFGKPAVSGVVVNPLNAGTLLTSVVLTGNTFRFISGNAFVLREINVGTLQDNVIDVTSAAINVDGTVLNLRIGLNEYASSPSAITGTPGAATTMHGGYFQAAALPAASNGSVVTCTDCTTSSPCAGGGDGRVALRRSGTWVCEHGTGGGGGGGIGGTIAATQIPFGTALDTIGGSANLTYASGPRTMSLLGQLSIAPPTDSVLPGILVSQSGPLVGTQAVDGSGAFAFNQIAIAGEAANAANAAGNTVYGFRVFHQTGGLNEQGSRIALGALLQKIAASNVANPYGDNIALGGSFVADSHDGGTNTSAGARGTGFGGSLGCTLRAGATNFFICSGAEVNVGILAGASSRIRAGWQVVGTGALQGAALDFAYSIGATSAPFHTGILFTNLHGGAPVDTMGTLIGTDGTGVTVAHGLDWSPYVFTSDALKTPGFVVDGLGGITSTRNDGGYQLKVSRTSAPDHIYGLAIEGGTGALAFDDVTNAARRMTLLPSGNLGIATLVPQATLDVRGSTILAVTSGAFLPAPPGGTVVQVAQADGASGYVTVDVFGTATNPGYQGRRARGAAAAPMPITTNDQMNVLSGFGRGVGGYSSIARGSVGIYAAEDWGISAGAQGSMVTVGVTPLGSTTLTEALRVTGITGGPGYRTQMSPTNTGGSFLNSRPFLIDATTSGTRTTPGADFVTSNTIAGFYAKNTDSSVAVSALGDKTAVTGFVHALETTAFKGAGIALVGLYEGHGTNDNGGTPEKVGTAGYTFAHEGTGGSFYGLSGFSGIKAAVTSFGLAIAGQFELNCQKAACATTGIGVHIQNNNSPFGQSLLSLSALVTKSSLGTGGGFADGAAWTYAWLHTNDNTAAGLVFGVTNDGRIQAPNLPQTGAATKKVMCWDAATGSVIISTTTTGCDG